MFCKKCGNENPDIALYCAACGAKIPEPNVKPVDDIVPYENKLLLNGDVKSRPKNRSDSDNRHNRNKI